MQKKIYNSIGLMSGTSLDGVDACIISSDGESIHKVGDGIMVPFPAMLRDNLKDLINGQNCDFLKIEREFTLFNAKIVNELLANHNINPNDIDLIGFHGQTIIHRPAESITWQIGDGSLLAHLTKINVISDFRRRDLASGGQGAPLVPLYHRAITKDISSPVVIVNIGGVSNVTYIDKEHLFGFDTGPGCALIDDLLSKNSNHSFDDKGMIAKSGKIHHEILNEMLNHDFFKKKPPKSLDRNTFLLKETLSLEDGLATLTAFTAKSISLSAKFFPDNPSKWVIAGGGRHNDYLLELLSNYVNLEVIKIDELGINGDLLEAQAFAYLAIRSFLGLSLTIPTTTGTSHEVTGGALYRYLLGPIVS